MSASMPAKITYIPKVGQVRSAPPREPLYLLKALGLAAAQGVESRYLATML